ncbi:MAG: DNA-3-methyladenine glycosylase [Methanocellales archaeon]|nr:DNA-3-methyladenine glycosylase [Methanocellales archaeon]MDD3291715.1 DNA-3-methyladenine glycosylase [Methanocellales archaeon]MDD5235065.1 DNA-3-methyladenine glycosylase [Methanocellales archaeon]
MIEIYNKLLEKLGAQQWWPAETPFEVVVGAILTQRTKWENVEMAIHHLKEHNLLDPEALAKVDREKLESLVKCTGFYRQKAERIQIASRYFAENRLMSQISLDHLRNELLSLKGIGKETADSILLYALNRPKFVIDAYTVRMCNCLGISGGYDLLQERFEGELPPNITLFKEFHALIVKHGKEFCNKHKCDECVLTSSIVSKD